MHQYQFALLTTHNYTFVNPTLFLEYKTLLCSLSIISVCVILVYADMFGKYSVNEIIIGTFMNSTRCKEEGRLYSIENTIVAIITAMSLSMNITCT